MSRNPAALRPTVSVDAELLSLCAEFQQVDARLTEINAEIKADTTDATTWEGLGAGVVHDRWWQIVDTVIDTPAFTVAGWAAKGSIFPAVLRDLASLDSTTADHRLTLSLTLDMQRHGHPELDADLLAACEAFQAVHQEMKNPRRGDTDADDDALGVVVDRWYAALDAAVAIPARTAAGQQAKLRTVYTALWDAMKDEPLFGNREEFAALTALAELLGAEPVTPAKERDKAPPAAASDNPSDISFFVLEGTLRDMQADISMIGHVAKSPVDVTEQVWHRIRDNLQDGFDQLNDTWQAAADDLRAKHVELDAERAAFKAELAAVRAERAPPGSAADIEDAEALWSFMQNISRMVLKRRDEAAAAA